MHSKYLVEEKYLMPEGIWNEAKGFLPPEKTPTSRGGRPGLSHYDCMQAITYRMRTGCQWNAIPRTFGSSSAIHARFQEWVEMGIFKQMHKWGLIVYDKKVGINWEWQSIDASTTKAPLGQEETGRNPTDRGKIGTKRHILFDGRGVPLALAVSGANRHEQKKLPK
jgi:putative transposase